MQKLTTSHCSIIYVKTNNIYHVCLVLGMFLTPTPLPSPKQIFLGSIIRIVHMLRTSSPLLGRNKN